MLNSKRVRDYSDILALRTYEAISSKDCFVPRNDRYSVKPDPQGNAQKIIKKCMKNSEKVSSLSIQNILVECSTFFMNKGLLRLQRV
jgi:hypothetical protein